MMLWKYRLMWKLTQLRATRRIAGAWWMRSLNRAANEAARLMLAGGSDRMHASVGGKDYVLELREEKGGA